MQGEAGGDGQLGMLLVGHVGVNRVLQTASTLKRFEHLNKWYIKVQVVLKQLKKGYFYQRARPEDIALSRRVIQGQRFRPAKMIFMVLHANWRLSYTVV